MTLFFLVIICITGYYLITKGKFTFLSSRSKQRDWDSLTLGEKKIAREQDFNRLLDRIKDNQKKQENGESDNKIMDPTGAIYAREIKEMFKPDYQDDPEWQRLSNKDKVKL